MIVDGELKAVYEKHFLPNYGVFDEDRYFQPGRDLVLLRCGEALVGPTVCEDIWQPGPPATDLALAGAHVITNISASPFHVGKGAEREQMLAARARDNSCWIVYLNAVGAQDELIFDGQSLVLDEKRRRRRARPGLRGGAARGRRGRVDGGRAAPARRAPPVPRPRAERASRPARDRRPGRETRTGGRRWRRSSRRCSTTWRRCAWPSSSASATTWRRTTSPTSCSASRAGSTRR